jgi:hypothetical protein
MAKLDDLPGYRRRFIITPAPGRVSVALEDDYHCMSVELAHADGVITAVAPAMERAPWTTCPGAIRQLQETFTGCRLEDAAERGEKNMNCTHLHDMTLLAAAHASDREATTFDILSSDPVHGRVDTELRRNGVPVMHWTLNNFQIEAPAEIAGVSLRKLGKWIATLSPNQREEARLLRWGSMVAHGRAIPIEQQSDPSKYPGNCYTFQPENAVRAKRVGEIRDFSTSGAAPLAPRP